MGSVLVVPLFSMPHVGVHAEDGQVRGRGLPPISRSHRWRYKLWFNTRTLCQSLNLVKKKLANATRVVRPEIDEACSTQLLPEHDSAVLILLSYL